MAKPRLDLSCSVAMKALNSRGSQFLANSLSTFAFLHVTVSSAFCEGKVNSCAMAGRDGVGSK